LESLRTSSLDGRGLARAIAMSHNAFYFIRNCRKAVRVLGSASLSGINSLISSITVC
jgi:hypothetical protein